MTLSAKMSDGYSTSFSLSSLSLSHRGKHYIPQQLLNQCHVTCANTNTSTIAIVFHNFLLDVQWNLCISKVQTFTS